MSHKPRTALLRSLKVGAVFAVAYVAGAGESKVGVPLAWMIGPMFASAFITLLMNA